ncbi:MAG: DUF2306 domain-containing protein [Rhizobacter sp.]
MPLNILLHVVFAVGALVTGPFALWARKGSPLHRLAGRVWVALMLGAALSSLAIRDFRLPNIAGYTPIHLLTVATLAGLAGGVAYVVRRNIAAHRRLMLRTYIGGCVIAGLFTLLPGRMLGHLLWHSALGWV